VLYLRSKGCKITGFHDFGLPTSQNLQPMYGTHLLTSFVKFWSNGIEPPESSSSVNGVLWYFFSNSLVKLNTCFQGVNKSWLIGQKLYVRHSSAKEPALNQPMVIAPHYFTHRHLIFRTDIVFIWASLNVILISQPT